MLPGLRAIPRRVRSGVRRLMDEAVLDGFDFDVPVGPTLVLVADADARRSLPEHVADVPHACSYAGVTVFELHDAAHLPAHIEGRWESVVVIASDRSDLRRVLPAVPRVGTASQVAIWLTATRVPLGLVPRPEWPRMTELESRRLHDELPGVVLRVQFARRVPVRGVVVETAVQSAPAGGGVPALYTGYLRQSPEAGLDVGARLFGASEDTVEHDLVVPVDVLVAPPGVAPEQVAIPHEHHVVGRAPVVVAPPLVAPVDETVFNPVRWAKRYESGPIELPDLIARSGHVTEGDMRRARTHRSVRVDLRTADVHDVLRLAMAGVPLEPVGLERAQASGMLAGLNEDVLSTLASAAAGDGGAPVVDLDDALEREEYSLRLRRATFDAHSTLAHRAARAQAAGLSRPRTATAGLPGISIVLATRREHELPNAVENVRKQVGAEIELVVASHGFSPDATKIRELLGDEHGLQVLAFDADARFGDVLTAAAQAASFDVVMKMDDDDWYSSHAVHDLLMARRYSGADMVGMPTEFVHLVPFNQTVRRREPAETYTGHVAGGTMTLSRDLLREVGWFRPVRRWVDAQLLAAVASVGGVTYRTHGLGYVLVRNEDGHTWTMDPEEFRNADHVERIFDGFRPPGLLPGEAPSRTGGGA